MQMLCRYPWNVIEKIFDNKIVKTENKSGEVWQPFLVTDTSDDIKCAITGDEYPAISIVNDKSQIKIVELPGPAISGDAARKITVDVGEEDRLTLAYQEHYPISKDDEKNSLNPFEVFFDQLLNETLFILRECLKVEKHNPPEVYWESILNELKRNDDNDPAKHALVVDLARTVIDPIERITNNPKRILRRIRAQERIQKVQEIDTHCLADLARRPGRTLPEKAGPKQRILAIKRSESIDTLENKVAQHCCKLAQRAAKRYLNEHENIQKSNRKKLVTNLHKASKRLPTKPSFKGVTPLREPCRLPNYTLLQNIHYAKVWGAYNQLVRNEDLRSKLWRWNRRLWSDFMAIFIADTIHSWIEHTKPRICIEVGEKIVQGLRQRETGKWLLSDVMPGPFILGQKKKHAGTLYVLDGQSWDALGDGLFSISVLNADYLFLWLTAESISVLPIYAMLPPPSWEGAELAQKLKEQAENVLASMKQFSHHSKKVKCQGAWILQGNWLNEVFPETESLSKNEHTCWQTAIRPDYSSWQGLEPNRFNPITSLVDI